jgi:23S rRNA pseudouridine1911/1915/1917 synthase
MEFIAEKSERLDKYLAEKIPGLSRVKLQNAIRLGAVKVNAALAQKPALKLKIGDKVVLMEEKIISPHEEFKPVADASIPLEIVYEDKDIVVVNKPAGLLVHPTLAERSGTLVNGLLARYPEMADVGENPLRPGIVHRLDKDTSGLIIACKNQAAFENIKKQFLERKVQKTYLALVEGVPKDLENDITYDIRPSTGNRLKKVAVKKMHEPRKKSRRQAQTHYKVREAFGDRFALLEVKPKTGRTHQIRVHLSAIGHPVAGDRLYGSKSKIAKHQLLHAAEISFTSPSDKILNLSAPLPADFSAALEKIKSR